MLSPLEIKINCQKDNHDSASIVYSSQQDIPATWKLSGNVVPGMGSMQLELSCIYLMGNRKDLEINNEPSIEQLFCTVLWLGMV